MQPGALKDVNFGHFWAPLKDTHSEREVRERESRHRDAQLHTEVAQLVGVGGIGHLHLRRRLLLLLLPPDELYGGGV